MIIKEILLFKCQRCGHEWIPLNKKEPVTCPKCNNPYWRRKKKDA